MNQSTVTVRINGQPYQMGCDAGQETHIEEMGRNVDAIVQQLVGSVGQIGDARLLAMAGLILSDQVQTANNQASGVATRDLSSFGAEPVTAQKEDTETLSAEQIDNLVNQITTMAETIERLAQSQE